MSAENNLPPLPPITLRDWLAGQALPHALARIRANIDRYGDRGAMDHVPTGAREAYRIADAMLAARDGDNG